MFPVVVTADWHTTDPHASKRGLYPSSISIRAHRECRKLLNPQSPPFDVTPIFTDLNAFDSTAVFRVSSPFDATSLLLDSDDFDPTAAFMGSVPFSASNAVDQREAFPRTADFTPLPLFGAPGQQSGGFSTGATAGRGLAGLTGLLLFLLWKRKKETKEIEEADCEGSSEEVDMSTIDEDDVYISEYGLSDSLGPTESEDEGPDIPQEASCGTYESDSLLASEHNPDELDFVSEQDKIC
jgi:hypothetical protein